MSGIAEFFQMGGYAWYVWGSYAVTFGLMLIEMVLLAGQRRTLLQRIARMVRLTSQEKS